MGLTNARVCLVHCMDPRIQEAADWLRIALGIRYGAMDRVVVAGGGGSPERFQEELHIAVNKHRIEEIILCGHEDCLAGVGERDLIEATKKVQAQYPQVRVRAIWFYLNGTREEIPVA